MSPRTRTLAFAMTALWAASQLVLTACADSSADENDVDAGGSTDGSTTLESSPSSDAADAGHHDADVETDADATVDADAGPCTNEAWCHTSLPPDQTLRSVWSDGAGTAWSVSDQGNILRWDGVTWQIAFTTTTGALATVWGRSPTDLWVGGVGGLWHGEGPDSASITWSPIDLGEANVRIASIWGSAAGDLWAVGRSAAFRGRAFSLPAGQTTWSLDPVSARTDVSEMRTVWGTDDGDLWVIGRVGSSDRLIHRRIAGQSAPVWVDENPYTDKTPADPPATFAGLGSIAGDVWLFGKVNYAHAMYWTGKNDPDAGTVAWKRSNWIGLLNTKVDTINRFSVWGTSANDLWTIGESGRISHWNGSTWRTAHITRTHAPVLDNLYAMWGRSNDDIWVVGANIALHKVSQAEAEGAK